MNQGKSSLRGVERTFNDGLGEVEFWVVEGDPVWIWVSRVAIFVVMSRWKAVWEAMRFWMAEARKS